LVELEAVKLVLKVPYLFIVGLHLGIMATRALHDLVDYELRVTSNIEVSDPWFDGDSQAHDECLVFDDVVGGRKMKPDDIAHVDSKG
jgi:hypothetical protein